MARIATVSQTFLIRLLRLKGNTNVISIHADDGWEIKPQADVAKCKNFSLLIQVREVTEA